MQHRENDFQRRFRFEFRVRIDRDTTAVVHHLKEAISFRGYAQRDPLVEYKKESYEYFEQMRFGYEDEIVSYLFRMEPQPSYVPDEDLFREPEVVELGPDEQGTLVNVQTGEGVQRVTRFNVGGVER